MAGRVAPYVDNTGLVFAYDQSNTVRSYLGEPTTNLVRYSNNVTGSNYGYLDEYDVCDLVKIYDPNIKTPIGTGATLLTQQAVTSFWHALNWFDAEENGQKCLSAFIYPVTPGITNFYLGMIADAGNGVVFNLDTLEITYGNGISNRNAYIRAVPGYPGWYRVAANIEGRGGGWVASIGIGQYAEYTPSAPFKSFYLCGLQYESGVSDHVTQPLPSLLGTTTTRSATQGLLDLTGNSTIDLTNVSFDSNAQMVFDGSNDSLVVGNNSTLKNNNTSIEFIIKYLNTPNGDIIQFGVGSGTYAQYYYRAYSGNSYWNFYPAGGDGYGEITIPNAALPLNQYHHIVMTGDAQGYVQFYINGIAQSGASRSSYSQPANWTPADLTVGGFSWDGYSNSEIPYVKIYNRVLETSEIQQNFNAVRGRYGI